MGNITYEHIINDFNQRGEVYEGTHSLINFAAKYYPKQLDAFCEVINRISDGEDASLYSHKPLDDQIYFAENK